MRILALCLLLFTMTSAQAALIIYNDRMAWQAAAGGAPDLNEDLNSVTTDTQYNQTPQTVGFVTFSIDATADNSWLIDADPAFFGTIPTVDGTTFATFLEVQYYGFGQNVISFPSISAFGFDYSGAGYSGQNNGDFITSLGDMFTINALPAGDVGFIGLLYNEGESFTSIGGVGNGSFDSVFAMGIDNFQAYLPSVNPPPSTSVSEPYMGLFMLMAVGMVVYRQNRA